MLRSCFLLSCLTALESSLSSSTISTGMELGRLRRGAATSRPCSIMGGSISSSLAKVGGAASLWCSVSRTREDLRLRERGRSLLERLLCISEVLKGRGLWQRFGRGLAASWLASSDSTCTACTRFHASNGAHAHFLPIIAGESAPKAKRSLGEKRVGTSS